MLLQWIPSSLFQYHMAEQIHFSYPREIKSYMSILKDVYIYVYSNIIDNSSLKPSMISGSESDSHSVVSNFLWPHELYALPGSSVHGILQARILEWVAIPFSRGSFQCRDITQVFCTAGRFFTVLATRKAFNSSMVMVKQIYIMEYNRAMKRRKLSIYWCISRESW